MKDRIKQLMDNQQLTQQRFAEMIDISPASLSSIFNDRTKPTLNHVDAIRKSFPNISLQWLLYGDGDMFNDSVRQDSQAAELESTFRPAEAVLDFEDAQPAPLKRTDYPPRPQSGQNPPKRQEIESVKIYNKPPRKITEIRIFYDDQTWETFLPQK